LPAAGGWNNTFRMFAPPAPNNLPIGDVTNGIYATVGTGNLQLAAYPWTGVDQLSIRFSKNVNINQNALKLNGVTVATYGFSNFVYNNNTFTATWTLNQLLSIDRLKITVDADGANAVRAAASVPPGLGDGAP